MGMFRNLGLAATLTGFLISSTPAIEVNDSFPKRSSRVNYIDRMAKYCSQFKDKDGNLCFDEDDRAEFKLNRVPFDYIGFMASFRDKDGKTIYDGEDISFLKREDITRYSINTTIDNYSNFQDDFPSVEEIRIRHLIKGNQDKHFFNDTENPNALIAIAKFDPFCFYAFHNTDAIEKYREIFNNYDTHLEVFDGDYKLKDCLEMYNDSGIQFDFLYLTGHGSGNGVLFDVASYDVYYDENNEGKFTAQWKAEQELSSRDDLSSYFRFLKSDARVCVLSCYAFKDFGKKNCFGEKLADSLNGRYIIGPIEDASAGDLKVTSYYPFRARYENDVYGDFTAECVSIREPKKPINLNEYWKKRRCSWFNFNR